MRRRDPLPHRPDWGLEDQWRHSEAAFVPATCGATHASYPREVVRFARFRFVSPATNAARWHSASSIRSDVAARRVAAEGMTTTVLSLRIFPLSVRIFPRQAENYHPHHAVVGFEAFVTLESSAISVGNPEHLHARPWHLHCLITYSGAYGDVTALISTIA